MTHSATSDDWLGAAEAVLQRYPITVSSLTRIEQGLINLTCKVVAADGSRFVLQRLNPVFSDAVNHNIAAVTPCLQRHKITTPELIRAHDGALSVHHADHWWRVITFLDGVAPDRVTSPAMAQSAARLLGQFHMALSDCEVELVADRPPVHDFERHWTRLTDTLVAAPGHRLYQAAKPLIDELSRAVAERPKFAAGAPRLVHGDPKISNILFENNHHAHALIDLDTIARMPLCFELGDALRSWCSTGGEDVAGARFDLDIFVASVSGYCESAAPLFDATEQAALLPATLQIHLELATRFLVDVFEEQYFAWDRDKYSSRAEHNVARVRSQLDAAASLSGQFAEAERRLAAIWI